MATILHIETSTDICSVAVSEDGQVIFDQEDHSGPNHAERLGTMVDEALSFTDNHAIPFDAVAVSCGPGSYTGLRIGVSMAKGVCYGRNLKLIAVPTLELLCVPILLREIPEEDALLCPMLDARRMEVYAGIYDRGLKPVKRIWMNTPFISSATVPKNVRKPSVIRTPTSSSTSTPSPNGCSLWQRSGS